MTVVHVLSWNSYQNFWQKKISAASLSFFRVCFGCFVMCDALYFLNDRMSYFPMQDYFFKYPFFNDLHLFRPFEASARLHTLWVTACLVIWAISGFLILLGHKVRLAASSVTLVLMNLFLREASFYLNHLVFEACLAFLCIWIKTDFYFVWRKKPILKEAILPRYQLAAFVGVYFLSYFVSALEKLRKDWLSGDIIGVNLLSQWEVRALDRWLYTTVSLPLLAWCIISVQLWAPFGLSMKKTRSWTSFLLLVFHIVNDQVFNIGLFSYLMLIGFCLYFDPHWPLHFFEFLQVRLKRILGLFPGIFSRSL